MVKEDAVRQRQATGSGSRGRKDIINLLITLFIYCLRVVYYIIHCFNIQVEDLVAVVEGIPDEVKFNKRYF